MVKKIFKIFGIVLGAVTAFVGAVVGVMAAMGKFKTPIVYPTVLYFAVTEETIIEQIPYSEGTKQTATLHSFMLVGTNPDEPEHEVNQKDCYVWFNDGESAKLITLCDAYRNPLKANSNNRYLVKCNEPIYYMINKLDGDTQTDGLVELVARSTNDTLKSPQNNFNIYIDRIADDVFVDGWGTPNIDKDNGNNQQITVGIDIEFKFDYVVGVENNAIKDENALVLKPIAKESRKEIELYYNVEGKDYGTDYVKVTTEEIQKPESPLNSILTYKDGGYVFKQQTNTPRSHTFYIVVYKTYEDKFDYETRFGEQTLINPNHHKLTAENPTTGKSYVSKTELTINVEDIEISEVEFTGQNVVLNLYSENDYITLNGTSGVDGAKDNNLGLSMKKGVGESQIEDDTRFDEITMNGFAWSDKTAVFEAVTAGNTTLTWDTAITRDVCYSTISLSEDLEIINYLKLAGEDERYYCTNGVAVFDNSDRTVKVLKAGSYLNFFVQHSANSTTTYKLADFEYTATSFGNGSKKSWNIVSETLPQLTNNANVSESLCLGILVVNKSGEFVLGNYFDTIPVSLNPVGLSFDVLQESAEFDIEFEEQDGEYDGIDCSTSKPFTDFIKINSGSYNACVFVVKEKDDVIVDTIPNVKYIIGDETYVLVGYFTDPEDKSTFVNAVRVNKNVTKANNSCNIFMLQLKNSYKQPLIGEHPIDGKKSFFEETNWLEGGVEIDADDPTDINKDKVVKLHKSDEIEISAKPVLNGDLLSVAFLDTKADGTKTETNKVEGVYQVYENTEDHEVVVSSTNELMWENLVNFYSLTINNISVGDYGSNLFITGLALGEDGELVITYDAKKCLSDDTTLIRIILNVGNSSIILGNVQILSGSPDDIVLNVVEKETSNEHQILLFDEEDDAKSSTTYLEVVVGYNGTALTYDFNLVKENNFYPIDMEFNPEISGSTNLGFQDNVDKGQILSVLYDAQDKVVFNTDMLFDVDNPMTKLVEKGGTTVLIVTIGDTTKYLKIVATTREFTLSNNGANSADKPTPNVKLSDLVSLTYKAEGSETETPVDLNIDNTVKITNLKSIMYGDGVLKSFYDAKTNVWKLSKNEAETPVLTAYVGANGWVFEKNNAYITLTVSFDVETLADFDKSTTIHDDLKNYILTFSSSIKISLNENWNDENERIFYVGTTVQLSGTDYKNGSTYSVLNIQTGLGGTFRFTVVNDVTTGIIGDYENNFKAEDAQISESVSIQILFKGTGEATAIEVAEIQGFKIRPNVIATFKDEILKSETNYTLDQIYQLKAYKTTYIDTEDDNEVKTYIYGSDETAIYSEANLVDKNENLSLDVDDNESKDEFVTIDKKNGNLKIAKMVELEEIKTRNIYLIYSYSVNSFDCTYQVSADVVRITNIYDVSFNRTGENETLTYKAFKEYSSFASLDSSAVPADQLKAFTLTKVECEDLDIEVIEGNKFKITSIVNNNYKGVEFVLTFTSSDETRTLTLTIQSPNYKIIPYTPENKDEDDNANTSIDKAWSGSQYDLFNGFYGSIENELSAYEIETLHATAILDGETKQDITTSIAPDFDAGGYTNGVGSPICEVNLSEISGEEKDVYVQFTITYSDKSTYIYEIPLTIENRQTIDVKYPEEGVSRTNGQFKFIEGFSKDELNVTGLNKNSVDRVYKLSTFSFEPVAIYTNTSTTINFVAVDQNKGIVRANVNDVSERILNSGVKTTNNVKVELIAYQTIAGFDTYYVNQGKVTTETNKVILGSAENGMFGTLIFKLTTDSGNFDYYFIYVYCVGIKENNVNVANNLDVVLYKKDIANAYGYTSIEIEGNAITYKELIEGNAITYKELIEEIAASKLKNTFNKEFTNTDLYLYNITATSDEETIVSNQWQKLEITDGTKLDAHFKTIKIGLVYNAGNSIYSYGTITIYCQPINDVVVNVGEEIVDDSWKYDLPNGNFTAKIKAGAETITSPFGTDWTAEVINVTKLDGTVVSHNMEVKEATPSVVNLGNKESFDRLITVEYSKNGTIAYVTYTYLATTLPDTSTIEPVEIGQFGGEDDGFINSINLTSTNIYKDGKSYKNFFFGSYEPKDYYKITAKNVTKNDDDFTSSATNVPISGTTLTFTQTTEQQEIKVMVTYTKFGNGEEFRIFTFTVLPGLYIDRSSVDDNSGLTDAKPVITTPTDDYESNIGSTLDIYYDDSNSSEFYKFTIGDMIIYTVDASKLQLSFARESVDENSLADYKYVLKGNDEDNLNVLTSTTEYCERTAGGKMYFVHTPKDRDVVMTIKVVLQDDSADYDETANLYIRVVKTYHNLKAIYLTEGATHENVASYNEDGTIVNSIENLYTELFAKAKGRYALIDEDGETIENVDLLAMGFNVSSNPNYINFAVAGNATLRNDGTKLEFNPVTTAVMCPISLSSKAGIVSDNINTYNFQIMPGTNVDGLDFSSTNGYDGSSSSEKYITFTMNDTGTTYNNANHSAVDADRPFVIGTMLDFTNNKIFTLNEFEIGSTNYATGLTSKQIIEGKYKDNATQTVVGGYTNGWQYQILNKTIDGVNYNFYVTFNTDNKKVELIVYRTDKTAKNLTITISLSGVNGANLILDKFTLYLSKDKVEEPFKTSIDTSIYANDFIRLVDDKKFVESSGADLTYELAKSTYTLSGKEHTITKENNELFIYDKTNKTIQTKPVGETIYALINFTVKSGNYVIQTVTYSLYINLNMQIVVNGGELKNNIGNVDPETNFVLTVDPIETFKNGIDVKFKETIDLTTNCKNNYYNVLNYNLYKIREQGNDEAKDDELELDWSSVEFSIVTKSDCFERMDGGIKFIKDYTGTIQVKLYVSTSNGTYSVDWFINVIGILTLESTTTDTGRINSSPLSSGTTVDLIYGSKASNVGVTMNTPGEFVSLFVGEQVTGLTTGSSVYGYYVQGEDKDGNTIYTPINTATATYGSTSYPSTSTYYKGKLVTYEYKIHAINSTTESLTNQQLFELSETASSYIGKGGEENLPIISSFEVALPNVPATNNDTNKKSYYVTYKIYVEYLGLNFSDTPNANKVQVFYVTYNVINYQLVQPNKADIDVSTIGATTVGSDDDAINYYYLDMFYYADVYTIGETDYTISYVDGVLQLYDGTNTYTANSLTANPVTFSDGTDTIKYEYYPTKALSKNRASITGGSWNQETIHPGSTTGVKSNESVFTSGFSNIVEFKTFIDNYLNKSNSVRIGADKYFKLVHIANGRYGINLAENGNLFNNELNADLSMMSDGYATITILAYSASNSTGFRLHAESPVTAKTSKKLSTMFLTSYFGTEELPNSTSIIGIGTPTNNDWVTNADTSIAPTISGTVDGVDYSKVYKTINIPNGQADDEDTDNIREDLTTYNVKKVRYTGTSSAGSYYSVTQDFYYIALQEGQNGVIIPDYNANGVSDSYFKIRYNNSLNLTNAVQVWKLVKDESDNYEIKKVKFDGTISSVISDMDKVKDEFKDIDTSASIITISTGVLDEYKLTHPNEKVYPTFTAIITDGTIGEGGVITGATWTLACNIEFNLYDYVQVTKISSGGSDIQSDGTNNITVDLKNQVSIATDDGYEILAKPKYKYSITNKKFYIIDNTETEITGTWVVEYSKFTASDGTEYEIVYDEENNIIAIKVNNTTYNINSLFGDANNKYFGYPNLSSVNDVYENGSNGYFAGYENGTLTLYGAYVHEYFTKNESETELKIVFTILTEFGSTEFEVVVKKS